MPYLESHALLARRDELLGQIHPLLVLRIDGQRIRCHGDFQLGHLLFTGKDFVVGSLEGDPNLPLSERRIKRSPLDDVACLLASVDAVARRVLADVAAAAGPTPGALRHIDVPLATRWLEWWIEQVSSTLLHAYESQRGLASLLPESASSRQLLLRAFRLELTLQELDLALRDDHQRLPAALNAVQHLHARDDSTPAV